MKPAVHFFRLVFKKYQWIHLGIGILGNILFLVGSIFFMHESLKDEGVWLFISGSLGMLIGNIGGAVVKYEEKKQPAKLL